MSLTCMEHKALGKAGSLQELVISIERDLKYTYKNRFLLS